MRWAKDKGLPVTCDVAMHQLYLTDDNLEGFNAMAYVLPPLRSNTDQQALRRGLTDGTIDAICSHHEPLNSTAKKRRFLRVRRVFRTLILLWRWPVNWYTMKCLPWNSW